MRYKKVEILKLEILIENYFFPVKAPSIRRGLIYSQLYI
jgi:hypothetical protein